MPFVILGYLRDQSDVTPNFHAAIVMAINIPLLCCMKSKEMEISWAETVPVI